MSNIQLDEFLPVYNVGVYAVTAPFSHLQRKQMEPAWQWNWIEHQLGQRGKWNSRRVISASVYQTCTDNSSQFTVASQKLQSTWMRSCTLRCLFIFSTVWLETSGRAPGIWLLKCWVHSLSDTAEEKPSSSWYSLLLGSDDDVQPVWMFMFDLLLISSTAPPFSALPVHFI